MWCPINPRNEAAENRELLDLFDCSVVVFKAAYAELVRHCDAHVRSRSALALHPADPLARARHRAWMEFGSSILADIWVVETAPDPAAFETRRQALRAKFERLDGELGEGPYFAGAAFSLVDAVFAPVFRYFDVFDRLVDLGTFTDLPKVQAWRRALAARPSVKGAVVADYEARLEAFLHRQPSHLAVQMKRAGDAGPLDQP